MAPQAETLPAGTAPRAIPPDPMRPAAYRVRQVRTETSDTFTLELAPIDGSPALAFLPGQFNMIYVFGVGEVPISISGDPNRRDFLVHTTRAVGAVTRAMHRLRVGDTIGVRGPYGTAWPVEASTGSDIVIAAGGIGLAPLRPAIYSVLSRREKFGRVVLLYGTRTPQDILFRRDLERWRARFDLEVYPTVDRASGGWRGSVGVVTALIARAPFDALNATAFVCGPEIMMRYTVAELQKRGLGDTRIHVSMERNMKCAVGLCGHCQFGPLFICKDGPVFSWDRMAGLFTRREI